MSSDPKVAVKADVPATPQVIQFGELTARVAATFAIEPQALWNSLKSEFFPGGAASDAQMFMVLQIMDKYKLNPFMREMFAAISQKTGKLLIGVQYDGYMTIAHRHPNYKGFQFEYEKDKDGKVVAIICKVHRSDWEFPGEYRAEMREWFLAGKDTWTQRPTHQLAIKAFNNAIRLTLGLSGIYDPDDVERIQDAEQKAIETTGRAVKENQTSVESPPTGEAAADTQTSPSAPAAAPTNLQERRKRRGVAQTADASGLNPDDIAGSTPTAPTNANADVAQRTEQGDSTSTVAGSNPAVSVTNRRAHLDALIAAHWNASRVTLDLGKLGAAKVEDLNDEQVERFIEIIEVRKGLRK